MKLINKIFCFLPFTADLFQIIVRQTWPLLVFIKNFFPNTNENSPNIASFQVANICNASCIFCAYPISKMKKGVMKYETFKKALAKVLWNCKDLKTIDLTPTVGDPLIDMNLFEKIGLSKDLNLNVVLTTNGILLYKYFQNIIDSKLDQIFISLPSFDNEDYKEVYGVDYCDLLKHGLAELLNKKSNKLHVHLRFRNKISPSKIIKSKFFQDFIKPNLNKNVSFNFTANFDNWGGTIKNLPKDMKMKPVLSSLKTPCLGLSSVAVLFDGKIRACGCRFIETDNDDLVIGSLSDEWKDIELNRRKLINDFKLGKRPKTCQNCSFYNPNSKINI